MQLNSTQFLCLYVTQHCEMKVSYWRLKRKTILYNTYREAFFLLKSLKDFLFSKNHSTKKQQPVKVHQS